MKQTETTYKKQGYANYKRKELLAILRPVLVASHGNLKNPEDPNVVSIKRFISAAILQSGKKADVLITVKESIANGHRIYSIELDEINKASERFQGLSDAAEKTATGQLRHLTSIFQIYHKMPKSQARQKNEADRN